jgi:hypothetical protein
MSVSQRRFIFHLSRWCGLFFTLLGVVELFRGNASFGTVMVVIGVLDVAVSVVGFRRDRLR